MIHTYTWKIAVPEHREPWEVVYTLKGVGVAVAKLTPVLLDIQTDIADPEAQHTDVLLTLKIQGKDRWAVQGNARKVAEKILQAARLRLASVQLLSVQTPVNRTALKDGEGRTPRPRPPRVNPMPS